ncbi:hypothetical protein AB0M36_05695 [Actinoplanes sp. NPDC051346]|uniref:hypothetical protein n=1 Tax=Actinoplanes sp. NPDC051346 TaxID=3155048 RepID=UPI003419FFD7
MTTVALAAGLVATPGAAHAADTTTTLSATEMAAALKTVATTTTAAAEDGWKATMSYYRGSETVTLSYVVDPHRGVAVDHADFGTLAFTEYAVDGKGRYTSIASSKNFRAAVRMMGRPAVKYRFRSEPGLKMDDFVDATGPAPAKVLTDEDIRTGTKTLHDNGSADFAYTNDDGVRFVMQVDPAGTLTDVQVNDDGLEATLRYGYGEQQVALPAAAATISDTTLSHGVAYLAMASTVKTVASEAAAQTRVVAQGRTVKVAALRKTVRTWATLLNQRDGLKIVKVKDISRGARVYATNPWTHKTVSYTVKASGRKVVVKG